MSPLQQFYEITLELLKLLENEGERDAKIAQLDIFLAQREELMDAIYPPFSDEEDVLGKQLVVLNQKVDQLLSEMKEVIALDIKELKEKKNSNVKYSNPYETLSVDGAFYDKRN